MPTTILNDYLRPAIERKDYQALRQFLEEFQAVNLAELLQTEPVEAARELLMHLPVVQRASVFGHLPSDWHAQLTATMTDKEVSQLLRHLNADEGTDLLHVLPEVRDAKLLTLYRKRIVWLLLLVFGNLISGAGIAYYEETIAAYVVLVFFLPLLIDSGGNAGSQAATLV